MNFRRENPSASHEIQLTMSLFACICHAQHSLHTVEVEKLTNLSSILAPFQPVLLIRELQEELYLRLSDCRKLV